MKKWLNVLLACLLFAIDSNFVNFFPGHLISKHWIFVPHFLFIFIIFLAVYYDAKIGILYAFFFGIITDIVFTEILGFYLFWYPAIVYLISKLMKILQSNLFIMAFITILSITFLEFGIYFFYSIITTLPYTTEEFFFKRYLPTIELNIVFFLLFSYHLRKFFSVIKKEKEEEEGMFQS